MKPRPVRGLGFPFSRKPQICTAASCFLNERNWAACARGYGFLSFPTSFPMVLQPSAKLASIDVLDHALAQGQR
jgi:hypothetical protein